MRSLSSGRPSYRSLLIVITVGSLLVWLGLAATNSAGRSDMAASSVAVIESPRIVVVKSSHRLHLFDGQKLIRSFPIDLGRDPVGDKRRVDDNRTPEGRFRICVKNADSPHHRFLGLDYPGEAAVAAGLAGGRISQGEAWDIRRALDGSECPKWDTVLGGGIGLHGRRRGTDWTAGCMALDDAAIEELFAIMRLGDEVEILP